jgi:hypothetical protein
MASCRTSFLLAGFEDGVGAPDRRQMPKRPKSGSKHKGSHKGRRLGKQDDPFIKTARAIGINPSDEEYERMLKKIVSPRRRVRRPTSQGQ